MADDGFLRARSPEQKAQRRAAILAAAGDLLDAEGIDGTSLAAIAARAGVVKSNLYRYFESREHILADLMLTEMRAAVSEIAASLEAPTGSPAEDGPARVARAVAAAYAARPRLCLLTSRMSSVLEHNISTAELVAFKRGVAGEVGRACAALARAMPSVPPEAGMHAVLFVHVLVSGLWPVSSPPPAVAALHATPEFAGYAMPFRQTFEAGLATFLRGILHESLITS